MTCIMPTPKRGLRLQAQFRCVNELVGIGDIPLLAKEGWTRHQKISRTR